MMKQIFLWILVFSIFLLLPGKALTISEDSSETETIRLEKKLEDVNKELDELRRDNYAKAMKNAERSIGLANNMLQVLIGAVVILGALGVISILKTGQIGKKVEKELKDTQVLKGEIETMKKEAENLMKDIKTVYEKIKKAEEEVERDRLAVEEKERSVDKSKSEVSAISLAMEGFALGESGKHKEAIEKYKRAIELKPDYVDAYHNWRWSLGKLGQHKQAIEKCKKLTELKPDDEVAYIS